MLRIGGAENVDADEAWMDQDDMDGDHPEDPIRKDDLEDPPNDALYLKRIIYKNIYFK